MTSKTRNLISGFSTAFIKRFRITLILFFGIILIGYLSYSNFLTKEGFPAAEIPIATVKATYFVGNVDKVDEEVTQPIENSISDINEIKQINSTTSKNFVTLIAEMKEDSSSEEGIELLKENVERDAQLPEEVELNFETYNAGTMDGKHNMILSLSNDNGEKLIKTQDKAKEIASELTELEKVVKAETKTIISKEKNPVTGKKFLHQSKINRIGFREIRENGELKIRPAIDIGIIKKEGVGTLKLSDAIKNKIEELKQEGKLDGYHIVFADNTAKLLRNQINTLESNIISGLIAILIVLLFFIGWRSSLVVGIFVPTVLGATFIGLYAIGYTLNVLVLFSLILVLGLFVDDAIVVVESIDYQKKKGFKGTTAVRKAIKDIGAADIAGTITTLLVFIPMAFLSGILGEFIRLLPITVILALSLSILIALSIIPFLARFIVAIGNEGNTNLPFSKRGWFSHLKKTFSIPFTMVRHGIDKLSEWVARFVNFYLRKPLIGFLVLVISLLFIFSGSYFSSKLDFSVFPSPKDTNYIKLNTSFGKIRKADKKQEIAEDIEDILLENHKKYINKISYFNRGQKNITMVNLVDMEEREITSQEIVDELEKELDDYKKASVKVKPLSAGPPAQEFQFFAQVYSQDKQKLKEATTNIKEYLQDKEIKEGEKVEKVKVVGLDRILKKDGERYAEVKAKISSPENTGLVLDLKDQVKSKFDKEKMASFGLKKEDLKFDLGQESENFESFQSALFTLGLVMIFLYILLVLQFNSFSLPLLILLAFPFTLPGVFGGLYYTDNAISFFVLIGIIALAGIVINNSIILMDFVKRSREKGKDIKDAISESVKVRFRPILATITTTIIAVLPLYYSDPFWEPLLVTIIFGLISGTVLVILAFPVYYALVERVRTRVKSLLKAVFSK